MAEATSALETIPATDGLKQLQAEDTVSIDVRELPEVERDGKIPGAVHASWGLLEFYADPESPAHNAVFASGKRLILYCVSGQRSALAAHRLQEMGLQHVAHLDGGMKAWKAANGPVETISVVHTVDRGKSRLKPRQKRRIASGYGGSSSRT